MFNTYMRISLSAFINNLRIEKSTKLIENESTIIDAAENSGMSFKLDLLTKSWKKIIKYGIIIENNGENYAW